MANVTYDKLLTALVALCKRSESMRHSFQLDVRCAALVSLWPMADQSRPAKNGSGHWGTTAIVRRAFRVKVTQKLQLLFPYFRGSLSRGPTPAPLVTVENSWPLRDGRSLGTR